MAASLSVAGLAIERGERLLFRDLSFQVTAGEVLSVHGRNGAGKSSLLRAVAGLLEAITGKISLTGAKGAVMDDRQTQLHFIGHADAVKPAMTVEETLEFWAALYGGASTNVATALREWKLTTLAALPGQYLSAGQKRRVALARLSVAPRPLWLLDEPSAALDTQARELLLNMGERHLATGGMIVAASHEPLWSNAKLLNLSEERTVA